jgi:hypothetical protein
MILNKGNAKHNFCGFIGLFENIHVAPHLAPLKFAGNRSAA